MPGSLLKYAKEEQRGGQNLYWSRADVDGMPFRSERPPQPMTEDEFEETTVKVADVKNGWFDSKNPAQNQQYLEIIDRCMNGWYRLIHLERFWDKTPVHYVEWAEYYLEGGQQTPYTPSKTAELANGLADAASSRQPASHPSGA